LDKCRAYLVIARIVADAKCRSALASCRRSLLRYLRVATELPLLAGSWPETLTAEGLLPGGYRSYGCRDCCCAACLLGLGRTARCGGDGRSTKKRAAVVRRLVAPLPLTFEGTYVRRSRPSSTALQSKHNQRAPGFQGSSVSPLTKKGSIFLYSGNFTVASLGALPCAIERNACSDCATIARARLFL
jgi:hypothetical protein